MELNATFNNISVISWRSVLLVEETGVPGKTTDQSQVTDQQDLRASEITFIRYAHSRKVAKTNNFKNLEQVNLKVS
jgi:hypothetical protein